MFGEMGMFEQKGIGMRTGRSGAGERLNAWRVALGAAAAAALILGPGAAEAVTSAEVKKTERAETRLIADVDAAVPGEPFAVALDTQLAKGWHSYWKNPGDSGEPAAITWTTPPGVTVEPIEWPAPVRFTTSGIMSYGYKTRAVLPMTVRTPADLPYGKAIELKAKATWLVCSDSFCIPEEQEFTLSIPMSPAPFPDPAAADLIAEARAAAPAKAGVQAVWRAQEGAFLFDVPVPELAGAEDLYFFPNDWGVIDQSAPQRVGKTADGVRFAVKRGEGPAEGAIGGVVTAIDKSSGAPVKIALDLTASPGEGAAPAATPLSGGAFGGGGGGGAAASPFGAGAGPGAVLLAALFAFLGGAILNLMPCVFPVLALKAVSLAKHSDADPRERVGLGLAYGAGVMASFLAFALVLVTLKAAGAAVGWGFQLQTPIVVAALAYVLFAVGLNLSGVFEVPTGSFAGIGGSLAAKDGRTGSFFTGVLAAVVASPCTAPFMGAALGYALTQNALVTLVIFAALAAGFAAPIVALSASPQLARMLPKPGAWMERFRQALAFPMYAAAAWLLWVLGAQVGLDALFAAMIGLVLVALAAWTLGVGAPASVGGKRAAAAVAVAALIGAGAALTPALSDNGTAPARAADGAPASGGLVGEAYAPERLTALRAEGRTVFLNVTADWCISCKVNERLVLSGSGFQQALETANAVYVTGDWTRRNPEISALLERFGRVGVPLYVVFPGDGGEPRVLPQILTEDIVRSALTRG